MCSIAKGQRELGGGATVDIDVSGRGCPAKECCRVISMHGMAVNARDCITDFVIEIEVDACSRGFPDSECSLIIAAHCLRNGGKVNVSVHVTISSLFSDSEIAISLERIGLSVLSFDDIIFFPSSMVKKQHVFL